MTALRLTLPLLLALVALAPAPVRAAPPWETLPAWSELTPDLQARAQTVANTRPAYGPCKETISKCFENKDRQGWRQARLIVYLYSRGATEEDVLRILEERRTSYNAPQQAIDVGSAARLGPANAPVSVVEFADFECPACAAVSPILKQTVLDLGPKTRMYFLNFPLKGHMNSLPAAQAAVTAQRDGKFWEMAEMLFANIDAHEPGDLDTYAKNLGLALPAFRSGMAAPETMRRIEAEKALGLKLGIRSTPTLFVNGREFKPNRDRFLIQDRLEEEIERTQPAK